MYFVIGVISAILIFILSNWIRWRKQRFNMFKQNKIPGPKPHFIYGNLLDFKEKKRKIIDEWIGKYGKIFGFFLGAKPYLVCADTELLKLCQVKDVKNFINKDWMVPDFGISHAAADYMLGIQKDEEWKSLRKVLTSCFSSGKVKMMTTLTSDPIKIFLSNIMDKNEKPFDIVKLSENLIFDIVCTSAFGVMTNIQQNESNLLIESVQSVLTADSNDVLIHWSVCFPEMEPIPTILRRFRDYVKYIMNRPAVTFVYNTCKNIINSRKMSKYHPPDLLQTIIDAEDDEATERIKLSIDYVTSNALLFMAAGYDTTSNTFAWCIYYLACHPDIQRKLRQEINDNIKRDSEIQYSDVNNLQYLNQVISETLRKRHLSFLVMTRLCADDYQYKDITIPKGSIITVPISVLHNDPTYWNEPDKFDPDRFLPSKRRESDSIMYQPFGVGPRMCIGMRLAKAVLKLVIANLVRSYRIEPYGNKDIEIEDFLFMTHPKDGVIVRAIPINS